MRLKEYRLKRAKDGTVMITPVVYGAKGRPVRVLSKMVKAGDMAEAAMTLDLMHQDLEDRRG